MIAKKNSRYDLERKRHVFFQIGLLLAGSFTMAAFNYSTAVLTEHEKQQVAFDPIYYPMNLETPPEEKKEIVTQDVKKEDESQTSPELDPDKSLENTQEVGNTELLPRPDVDLPSHGISIQEEMISIDEEEIIEWPPIEAHWKNGGYEEMQNFINKETKYPEIDVKLGNEGVVYVSFVVEKDGSISNIKIERGVSETIDREAERVVRSFPLWQPAESAHGKVRARVRLPLKFILKY